MKVRDLIAELLKLPQHSEVVMSSDAEGNSYSPFSSMWEGVYVADEQQVYVGAGELTKQLEDDGYGEDDMYDGDDFVPAVIFTPN